MYIKEIIKNNDINLWLFELNKSFKHRSSEKIPYEELKYENIKNTNLLGVFNDEDELIGGVTISYYIDYNNIKVAMIKHLWTKIDCQRQGIGSFLMKELENIALKNNCQLLQLNVTNIYIPAVHLYEKSGFKKLMVYANVPGTYYFIRMIKSIGKYKFPEYKRIYELVKSIIVFKILFKSDSSPTFVHDKIYKKLKS